MLAPMPELLLHQYDGSPFSEKIRLIFGRKGLAWRAVEQPNIMPKPQLVPLTGGYRRIPVLQIGADIYCDTQLIARVIERLHPEPTIFPRGSEGLCTAFGFWADRLLFLAAVPVLFGKIGPAVPKAFIEDRSRLMGGGRGFEEAMRAGPLAAEQLRAHASFLEMQLSDGRPYLLGDEPSLADFAAYHPVWFLRALPPTAATFDEFRALLAWAERVKGIGHGARGRCTPDEAMRIARDAKPTAQTQRDPGEPNGIAPGDRVVVHADDYGFEEIEGELVSSGPLELALRRTDREVGEVVVHFPRAGFRVKRV
jgi:glutathione S-transferase